MVGGGGDGDSIGGWLVVGGLLVAEQRYQSICAYQIANHAQITRSKQNAHKKHTKAHESTRKHTKAHTKAHTKKIVHAVHTHKVPSKPTPLAPIP